MPKIDTHLDKARSKSSSAFANNTIDKKNIRQYFRKMRIQLITGLMIIIIVVTNELMVRYIRNLRKREVA